MFEPLANNFNVIGLALIPAVLWLSWSGVKSYWPRIHIKKLKDAKPVDLLMLGIVISLGIPAIFNVLWWGVHFFAVHHQWARLARFTWEWGQFANVVTRYIPYILAPAFHLMAAYRQGVKGVHHPRIYAAGSATLTLVAYSILQVTA